MTRSSAKVLISRYQSNNFSFATNSFIFLINFCIFWWPVNVWALNFMLPCFLFWSFCLFVLFLMLWMLVSVNKTKFSQRKTLKTFFKIPAFVWMLVTVFKIMININKIHILTCLAAYFHHYYTTFTKACDMPYFHEISNWNKYLSRNFKLE